MPLIEVELRKEAFEAIVGATARSYAAVPTPTLAPLGDDRLIREFTWLDRPSVVQEMPGYTRPAGTVLLRGAINVSHVSLAELRIDANALGAVASGFAWLLAQSSPGAVSLSMVGFGIGEAAPWILDGPVSLMVMPFPVPSQVGVVKAALVADDSAVVYRLATAITDDLFRPMSGRVKALDVTSNWAMHVPAQLFCDVVMASIAAVINNSVDAATLEEMPTATWCEVQGGAWGVQVHAALEKKNACPGVFEDADISVDIMGTAAFTADDPNKQVLIALEITADASDWDSFRCWLGSGGIASFVLNLALPFTGVVDSLASLVFVSEEVRSAVGDALASHPVPSFTKTGQDDSTVTYSGSFPVLPIPSMKVDPMIIGPEGLDVTGLSVVGDPKHATKFNPDGGTLSGSWTRKVNCSTRSMDSHFAYNPVVISDNLTVGGDGVVRSYRPVIVFLTSVAEPASKYRINMPDADADVAVVIDGPAMPDPVSNISVLIQPIGPPHPSGFAVLHTSAGLRAYALGVVGRLPDAGLEESFIDQFCDTFHIPLRLIDIHELRWIEPPPDYNWGLAPLRQWQLAFTDLPAEAKVALHAARGRQQLVASRRDFSSAGTSASMELVTDGTTDLVMRTSGASDRSKFALTTRWLQPLVRTPIKGHATAIQKAGRDLLLNVDGRWQRFDSSTGQPRRIELAHEPNSRKDIRPGQTIKLRRGRVALLHDEELVIAIPANSVVRSAERG